MTFEEFKSSRLMDPQKCSATKLGNHVMSGKPIEIPGGRAHFDWSMFGKVTPVKNQVLKVYFFIQIKSSFILTTFFDIEASS